MRREEPLWIHRSQATLAGPRDPGPVSHGPAPPGLRFCASVPPVALATGSLRSNQHCYHRSCLEPGGSSGQQWSAGSHACLRPFPVQALGKSKEGVEENGWEREWMGWHTVGVSLCDGIGSPKARHWREEAEINSQCASKINGT